MTDPLTTTLLEAAAVEVDRAEAEFGRNPSCEFAACRVAEEMGELIQAATAVSKGRSAGREGRVWREAVQAIAMVVRLVREFPEGAPRKPLRGRCEIPDPREFNDDPRAGRGWSTA